MDQYCPNFNTCKLVTSDVVIADQTGKKEYLAMYCEAGEDSWKKCKRFITKDALKFCPDFVLPDNPMCIDEIMDKFDEGTFNNELK